MSTRKTTLIYALPIAVASLAVGMVLASRLDLTPSSAAQNVAAPSMNTAPLTGIPIDAGTFRNIAKAVSPAVVYIKTEMKAKAQDLNDFFGRGGGGGGSSPDDLFRRFFGGPQGGDDQQDQGGGRRQRGPQIARASGTGFIISRDGLILTNNHVVEEATKIQVYIYGEDE
jgi:serine protease Do